MFGCKIKFPESNREAEELVNTVIELHNYLCSEMISVIMMQTQPRRQSPSGRAAKEHFGLKRTHAGGITAVRRMRHCHAAWSTSNAAIEHVQERLWSGGLPILTE